MHVVEFMAAALRAHGVHAVELGAAAISPGKQGAQVGAAGPAKVPTPHERQTFGEVAPIMFEADPAGQPAHEKAPGVPMRNWPTAQITGVADGVIEGVGDAEGVIEGVAEDDGVIDGVAVADEVIEGVSEILEVIDGVADCVIEAVGDGESDTDMDLLELGEKETVGLVDGEGVVDAESITAQGTMIMRPGPPFTPAKPFATPGK